MQKTLFWNSCPHCGGKVTSKNNPPGSHRGVSIRCSVCHVRADGETFSIAMDRLAGPGKTTPYTAGKSLRIIMEKDRDVFEEKIQMCKSAGFNFLQKRITYKCHNGSKDHTAVMGLK